jgi:hypothetical protein
VIAATKRLVAPAPAFPLSAVLRFVLNDMQRDGLLDEKMRPPRNLRVAVVDWRIAGQLSAALLVLLGGMVGVGVGCYAAGDAAHGVVRPALHWLAVALVFYAVALDIGLWLLVYVRRWRRASQSMFVSTAAPRVWVRLSLGAWAVAAVAATLHVAGVLLS